MGIPRYTSVTTKGELTSKLFTEHYSEPLHHAIAESAGRV